VLALSRSEKGYGELSTTEPWSARRDLRQGIGTWLTRRNF